MDLKILVQRLDERNNGHFKDVYRNTLHYDDNVQIPFNRLYDGLRLLYPQKDVFINFIIT